MDLHVFLVVDSHRCTRSTKKCRPSFSLLVFFLPSLPLAFSTSFFFCPIQNPLFCLLSTELTFLTQIILEKDLSFLLCLFSDARHQGFSELGVTRTIQSSREVVE